MSEALELRRRLGVRTSRGARSRIWTGVLTAMVALLVLLALVGPWLAPHDPTASDLALSNAGPAPGHPLGFDSRGRDLLSRLLAGARPAMLGPAFAVLVAALLGTTLAIVASWTRGWADSVISTFLDITFAFPAILLAILAASVFGRGLLAPGVALAIAYTPYIARVVRSASMVERRRPYVAALELQGFSAVRICARHLVPNLMPLITAQSCVIFGYAILDFAAISYLGLGVQPPAADWGVMISDGQGPLLQGYPAESLYAGAAVVITVLVVNLLGERVAEGSDGTRVR